MTTTTTQNLLKNFDLQNLSNLLDDPKNEKYFGKKENMVSVDKPFASKPFNELIENTVGADRIWSDKSEVEIEEKKRNIRDRTIFVGGFKKISRVPFWMRTYRKDYSLALRTFEKKSIAGERNRPYSSMYEKCRDIPFTQHTRGTDRETYEDFLPGGFGLNNNEEQWVSHETFWDNDFQCFLWFYDKLLKKRKRVA